MSEKFSFTKDLQDSLTLITLEGVIDEDAILEDVFTGVSGNIHIDLGKIARINSCGIRTWVNIMGALSKNNKVTFLNCPPVLVRQFNMISNFGGDGEIASFMLPYYCATCDEECDVAVVTKEYLGRCPELSAPEEKCKTCGDELEFDDIEEKYFHFLNQKK